MSPLDRQRLDAALDLATQAIGLSDPNPRVGCIIGTADGRILGQGHTQQAGGPHAEVMALRDARSQGLDVRGATAWVTLEPCAHHGRTPPCADALVEAGLGRVVVAVQDPFPQVAGQGIGRLLAAGIEVELADADIAARARDLNIGFFSRFERGRPWVRLKAAASLDGRTALANGRSQWITGPEARADGQRWRRRASAILTGVGTVLTDDPRLDVRLMPTTLQPTRIVLDSRLRTPLTARILAPPGRCLIVATDPRDALQAEMLRDAGSEVVFLTSAGDGRICLGALVALLQDLAVNELHVEAGSQLNGSLLQSGLVDELLVYTAPILLGDGPGIASLPPLSEPAQALRFRLIESRKLGPDWCQRLRAEGKASAWVDPCCCRRA